MEAEERTFEASGLRAEVSEHMADFGDGEVVADVFAVDAEQITPAMLRAEGDTELQIVLGGFAASESRAVDVLRMLSERAPTLLLMGGEDDVDVLDAALEELDDAPLLDLRGIRTLRVAGHGYVVVAGSPAGRYTSSERGCGFDEEDLETLAEAGEGASLLSWAMPREAAGLDRVAGVSAGDPWLARLRESTGLIGGLHAWPREHAGEFSEGVGAAPILGRSLRLDDGSVLESGVLRVRMTGEGATLFDD